MDSTELLKVSGHESSVVDGSPHPRIRDRRAGEGERRESGGNEKQHPRAVGSRQIFKFLVLSINGVGESLTIMGINGCLTQVCYSIWAGFLFVFPDYQKSYFEIQPNVSTG